jgi:DNA-binding NtrC family response regulator
MPGGRILVVDDEFLLRDSIRIVLEKEGYEVFTAADGEEAMKQLEAGLPQVVLSDIKMPKTDGIELLKTIKAEHPEIEVVMLTGYPTIEAAVNAIKLGAYDYITREAEVVPGSGRTEGSGRALRGEQADQLHPQPR